ncbi:MAG: ATP-binding protein [Myxococcales bacterium]|nr:ATP-binding protein [Myxococcales bacterium]
MTIPIETLAFQTRARTVDHLGREQIADCPTAVSELWKNAYDAYARTVGLYLYDGNPNVAAIVDDGHGMNRREMVDSWLVLGTDAKVGSRPIAEEDRNGLPPRIRQGQKGIGRLSAASLGPLMLIVSKRRHDPFVAALVDWRLFENPYLYLQDLQIPVAEFDEPRELMPLLPSMTEKLLSNVWGSVDPNAGTRNRHVIEAWQRYSLQETEVGKKTETTQNQIEAAVIETVFAERHFQDWPVWNGTSSQGTMLVISNIQFDLQALFSAYSADNDGPAAQARELLFQTLATFTDPFSTPEEIREGYGRTDFVAHVRVSEGNLIRDPFRGTPPLTVEDIRELEHVVEGTVDKDGVFYGSIKAFGEWRNHHVVIKPPSSYGGNPDSAVGPFHVRLGSFERKLELSTHTKEVHQNLVERVDRYGGLSVYRNGLRVMPYGREGNDYFKIEKRRTEKVGRHFWSLRRMFGRVALRFEHNPNLRDKAGREGFIDNKAAKLFRDLVQNILISTAVDYFGSDSELRKTVLPDIEAQNKKAKASEALRLQRVRARKQFRANLKQYSPVVDQLLVETAQLADQLRTTESLDEEDDVFRYRRKLQDIKDRFQEISLGEAPRNLGSLDEDYGRFRKGVRQTKDTLKSLTETLDMALERIKPKSPAESAYSELSANAAFLHKRLRVWTAEAKKLLTSELQRIDELQAERNKLYHAKTLPLLDELRTDGTALGAVLSRLHQERDEQDKENAGVFEPYIDALKSLREQIDIAIIARYAQEETDALRDEVDRLHGLAQLGITVEIVGHEFEGLEQTIRMHMERFPDSVRQSPEYLAVDAAVRTLIERLRFLSPLKLSGPKVKTHLTGARIDDYLRSFFAQELTTSGIQLLSTGAFLRFSIDEYSWRIFPVFVNLVNNALFWVRKSQASEKMVVLDVVGGKVVVADNGPGVDEDDKDRLFRLFFTRKLRGGRGVGLYLCRVNLASGGHTIDYDWSLERRLPGANFLITFSGARYG